MEFLFSLAPASVVGLLSVLVLFGAHRFMRGRQPGARGLEFQRPLVMIGLTLLAFIAVVINLPIEPEPQVELLRLLGLLLSAAIALSATTLLSNAMGGLMVRSLRNFKIGDFILVEGNFGRVTERGLFHTEIQTEERDLITLPNTMLVTSAVRHLRPSGTIVSTQVSLGYDVRRDRIEACLIEAATRVGLEDSFVQVRELGDFAVTYRISGLLVEVKRIMSARSELAGHVMDALHAARIEIVSPTVMTTRALREHATILPGAGQPKPTPTASESPEAVVFDKADEAEQLEHHRERHADLLEQAAELSEQRDASEPGAERDKLEARIARLQELSSNLEGDLESRADQLKHGDE